jgi:hypothetical protein
VWSTRRALASAAAVGSLLAAGCSLLVHFNDQTRDSCDGGCADASEEDAPLPKQDGPPTTDSGSDAPADADPCAVLPDDASCGAADPCNARSICQVGHCVHHPLEAGTYCGYNGGCQCAYCDNAGACSKTHACPEGFNWEAGVDIARCCGGLAVMTDTNANCGVCGVPCMTAGVTSVQNCQLISGHYQCGSCGANTECWSGCCAIDTTPNHCAASNCSTGACVAGLCPAPAHCVPGNGGPNYCSY